MGSCHLNSPSNTEETNYLEIERKLIKVGIPEPNGNLTRRGIMVTRTTKGDTNYSDDGKKWNQLKVGMRLREGAYVRTNWDSQITFFLGVNGPVLRVKENSKIQIVSLRFDKINKEIITDKIIVVHKGTVKGSFKNRNQNSRSLICSQNGQPISTGSR